MDTVKTEVKKGQLFVQEVLKRLTGDNDEAMAIKVARKSVSAVSGQIAALEAKEIDDELALEEAREALQIAIYPTTFVDAKVYCQGIVKAQSVVDNAEDNLEDTKDSLNFFIDLYEKF